ncbi:tautomerase-like protein [Nocardia tenerifensis]|uniref:Tautomerase-like protein n=1 Tax=Nocardia tenerifensis TaxID=228006 RepID=A0A318KFQ4_9NOCA|nr:tautomerase family protein [Nocardia tenerifensis]PXX58698.1 tautomerase-like protein [Nocardia tenerifensis]
MPLTRIALREDTPQAIQRAIADGIHRAMVNAIGIPPEDRFQIIEPRRADELIFDSGYLGVERRNVVYVQIAMVRGRPAERKQALYRAIADELGAAGVRAEDIVITVIENGREDWSIGNGHAQLLDAELLARHGISPVTPGTEPLS